MTKKILIDEAVVRRFVYATAMVIDCTQLEDWQIELHDKAGADLAEALADAALREALEVNNKGVDALAEPLTLDDLKVLRKAARCLQWAIQTESFLEKVAPGGHSNEKDYGDAAEGLKRICAKYSITPQTAEQATGKDAPPINVAVMPCGATVANVYEAYEAGKRAIQQERLRQEPIALQPLTDEQCDAIYTALDEWSREVDAHDFGLPAIAGGGMEKGREIIRAAHHIASTNKGE